MPKRIWVFGGQVSSKEELPGSIRDAFLRTGLEKDLPWIAEISKPEDYPDWWAFSGYEDLLLFERDAGYLSRLIVLFAESPGAIAELGALALDSNLYNRLFVIVARQYREDPHRRSFINLGPLTRIESGHLTESKGICVIEANKVEDLTSDEVNIIFDELDQFQSLVVHHSQLTFTKNNPTHQLLLIADLVDLLQVSKFDEILELLTFLEITYTLEQLKRSSKLLDLLGLIRLSERGSEAFLVRRKTAEPLVDYAAISGKRFERLSFKTQSNRLVQTDPRRKPLLETLR